MNILTSYPTYIMPDKQYYDISSDKVSTRWSAIGTYAEIGIIASMFVIGPTFDMLGRKWPIIIS